MGDEDRADHRPDEREKRYSKPTAVFYVLMRRVCRADGTKKRADFYVADDRAEGNTRKKPLEKRYREKHSAPEDNREYTDHKSSRRQCDGNRPRENTKRR